MAEHTPITEEIREEYAFDDWDNDPEGSTRRRARFDRWLASHDAEVRASVVPGIGMPCANQKPHPAHAWQMRTTGWSLCAGVVTEEPDWEYRSHVVNEMDRHVVSDWTDQETALAILGWEGGTVRTASWLERRRPAGEPERVPVRQEGTTNV